MQMRKPRIQNTQFSEATRNGECMTPDSTLAPKRNPHSPVGSKLSSQETQIPSKRKCKRKPKPKTTLIHHKMEPKTPLSVRQCHHSPIEFKVSSSHEERERERTDGNPRLTTHSKIQNPRLHHSPIGFKHSR